MNRKDMTDILFGAFKPPKPQARTCEYCHKPKGVDKFRVVDAGKQRLVWAHLRCFGKLRRQLDVL